MHEIVNPDDVGMRQFEAAFGFALELIKRRTIVDHQIGKKFQRDIALQLFVSRQPDNSHSASTEDLDQRVTAKDFLSAGTTSREGSRRLSAIAWAFVPHFAQTLIVLSRLLLLPDFWKTGFMPSGSTRVSHADRVFTIKSKKA